MYFYCKGLTLPASMFTIVGRLPTLSLVIKSSNLALFESERIEVPVFKLMPRAKAHYDGANSIVSMSSTDGA